MEITLENVGQVETSPAEWALIRADEEWTQSHEVLMAPHEAGDTSWLGDCLAAAMRCNEIEKRISFEYWTGKKG